MQRTEGEMAEDIVAGEEFRKENSDGRRRKKTKITKLSVSGKRELTSDFLLLFCPFLLLIFRIRPNVLIYFM